MEMMVMEMYFYWGTDVVFLLEKWTIKDNTGVFLCAWLVSFLAAILVEFLNTRVVNSDAVYAVVHSVQLFCSYMLMLVLMTFNGGLFIAVILGYTIGYSLFGFAPITFRQKGDSINTNWVNQQAQQNDLQ
jgi:predicted PurR-regulated permease PerM